MKKNFYCAVGELTPKTKIMFLGKVFYIYKHIDNKTIIEHSKNGVKQIYQTDIVKVL